MDKKDKGLAFQGMLEKKVKPETRAKFPILDKLIPISNYIACGVAVVVVVVVVAACFGRGGDKGKQTASEEGSEPDFAFDLRISQEEQEEEFGDFEQNLMNFDGFVMEGQNNQAPARGNTGDVGTVAWVLREGPKRLDAMEKAVTNKVSSDEWDAIEESAYDIVYAIRLFDDNIREYANCTPEQKKLMEQLDERYESYVRRRNAR